MFVIVKHLGCRTRIRTLKNRTKICCVTVTPYDNCGPSRFWTVDLMIMSHLLWPTELGVHLGKEKMVAWTSPFTIGVTQVYFSQLRWYRPKYTLVSLVSPFPNQPKKCSSAFYSQLRGIVSYLALLTAVRVLKFKFCTGVWIRTRNNSFGDYHDKPFHHTHVTIF